MLEIWNEIAKVVPDLSAESPSVSLAVQSHTVIMRRSTAHLLSTRSQPAGSRSTCTTSVCLCQKKIFF